MDDQLRGSQDSRVESLWASLDAKKDGRLDLEGLKKGLRKLNHPLQNADDLLKDVIKAVDTDGDGEIHYHGKNPLYMTWNFLMKLTVVLHEEFASFVRHAEKQLWTLFKTIDRDSNNKISREELQYAFQRSEISVSDNKIDDFFSKLDANNDGQISFDEWREFLLFIPAHVPGLKAVMSYYSAAVKVNAEGDVQVSDDVIQGLGTARRFFSSFFNLFMSKPHKPATQTRRPASSSTPVPSPSLSSSQHFQEQPQLLTSLPAAMSPVFAPPKPAVVTELWSEQSPPQEIKGPPLGTLEELKSTLTALLPSPGYFVAGGVAGIVSRTTTAPLDRLKVYLITQTGTASKAIEHAKQGAALQATKHAARPLVDACKALWAAGGMRSLFAGNGLNVAKVMPESAIKFGSYEASKRLIARMEGHNDPQAIHPWSKFVAGGMGGIISQFFVYPVDTLKFRMQCETVQGGQFGNALIIDTAKKMWARNGMRTFYRGLPMGLIGMFPYSAIDLGTFEYLKRRITLRNAKLRGCDEENATPGAVATATIGGFSGALGASLVYPLNLVRTRLQTQGTAQHPRTYTGVMDVTMQTYKGEGLRGFFKGLTPNLLKVIPAVSITYVVYENTKKVLKLS